MKKDTMFFEAEYKEASERISIRTPTEAKASVEWLTDEWNKAKRRNKKKRLKNMRHWQGTVLML